MIKVAPESVLLQVIFLLFSQMLLLEFACSQNSGKRTKKLALGAVLHVSVNRVGDFTECCKRKFALI